MSNICDPMLDEFREEAGITRRVLDRVPEEKFSWKPHAKSLSLGQLALHIAAVPAVLVRITRQDSFEISPETFQFPYPASVEEIRQTFESSLSEAEEYLQQLTDDQARAEWSLTSGGTEVLRKPRLSILRSIMFNHLYHHRGQLSVYLRLLEIPVPSIYGPSADEGPFTVAEAA